MIELEEMGMEMGLAEDQQQQSEEEAERFLRDDIFDEAMRLIDKAQGIHPAVRADLLFRISQSFYMAACDCAPGFEQSLNVGQAKRF